MFDYNIDNKEYLLSIKPKYVFIPIIIIVIIVLIIILLFNIKSYDVYKTKAYFDCKDECNIIFYTNVDDINKVTNIDMINLNKIIIDFSNINIGNIELDEKNKANYQIVSYLVKNIDENIKNTFQEVKVYSKYESIINKLIKKIT